jgi:hypothetical protein
MFIKRHLEKKRPLEKLVWNGEKNKTIFALVPFRVCANIDGGKWIVSVTY